MLRAAKQFIATSFLKTSQILTNQANTLTKDKIAFGIKAVMLDQLVDAIMEKWRSRNDRKKLATAVDLQEKMAIHIARLEGENELLRIKLAEQSEAVHERDHYIQLSIEKLVEANKLLESHQAKKPPVVDYSQAGDLYRLFAASNCLFASPAKLNHVIVNDTLSPSKPRGSAHAA